MSPVSLLAAESFIMTGTAMPVVTPEWVNLVSANFIAPTAGQRYVPTPVTTPAQFWPITGPGSLTLDASTRQGSRILGPRVQAAIKANLASGDPIAIFGYSQSAWIAAIEKQVLSDRQAAGEELPPINFVMLGNPVRPNGGLFSRFPSWGVVTWTPVKSAPTGTGFRSYDIARQYDPLADFPRDPSNLLALTNAAFGLMNHDYSGVTVNPNDPRYDPKTVVQQYGDTTYYLIPSKLPMLQPLRRTGFGALADALEPVLTPIVEAGYDRSASYGKPVPATTPFGAEKPAGTEKESPRSAVREAAAEASVKEVKELDASAKELDASAKEADASAKELDASAKEVPRVPRTAGDEAATKETSWLARPGQAAANDDTPAGASTASGASGTSGASTEPVHRTEKVDNSQREGPTSALGSSDERQPDSGPQSRRS
jgi:hypothetical protein